MVKAREKWMLSSLKSFSIFVPSNLITMQLKWSITKAKPNQEHQIFLTDKAAGIKAIALSKNDEKAALDSLQKGKPFYQINGDGKTTTILFNDSSKPLYKQKEALRRNTFTVIRFLNTQNAVSAHFQSLLADEKLVEGFVESATLSSYQFLKYKTKEVKKNSLQSITIEQGTISKISLDKVLVVSEANLIARDLINEPLSYLTAVQLSNEIVKLGKSAGFKTTVFDKKKIEALKMGGLLSVNRGSQKPPTFTVLEYKPAKAKNKKPIVLVGKGVVYDTGGLSLKPTPNSMDMMKCDMSGAAAVAGILYAIAKLKLNVHVVGLVPATDNRPGEDAYVPGDVVAMMNGMNVEVLNTDAEGRMILADALHYAKRYDPELVCDFATLTGAAKAAIGGVATVYMGTAEDAIKAKMQESSLETYERLVEFPLWEEYGNMIKSDVADIKNVGGAEAGAITAGKFLEHFTDYPWLHFDIAGPAYLMAEDSYRGKYGTGTGVRLLVDFISKR